MKLLEEFYELKSNRLAKEESIIKGIEGETIVEKTTNILNWFMFNDTSNGTTSLSLFESENVEAFVKVKPRTGLIKEEK